MSESPTAEHEAAAQDALLESLLEQYFECAAGADSHPFATTAARPPRGWGIATAAALLLGTGAVAWMWWPRERPTPAPAQDKGGPTVSTHAWRPPSGAALRGALSQLVAVRVRCLEIDGVVVKAADFPPGPLVPIFTHRDARNAFCGAIDKALRGAPRQAPWHHALEVRLEFTGDRHVVCGVLAGAESTPPRLAVDGLGLFPVDQELADRVAREVFLAAASQKTRAALGLCHPRHLAELPDDAVHLRLHAFTTAQLPLLSRFHRATSLDLRFAPALGDAASLRALNRTLPRLRTLRLRGDALDEPAWQALAAFAELEDLQVLRPDGSSWGVPAHRDAERVGDAAAAHLIRLTRLTSLVLPGSSLSDRGLAQLAGLRGLGRLCVSGSAALTGTGFATFADHPALAEVHANGCTALSDDGLRALARVPGLRQLFLRHVRKLSPATLADMRGNVSAAGLAALAGAQGMRRLELGGWFRTSVTHPLRFAKAPKDADGSILARRWRPALAGVAALPALEWLALDGSPDLVLADLEALRGSSIRVLNVAGTVGAAPARVPVTAIDRVFAMPRSLETLIHED
ncbi:MAG: hypothetical protein H6837_20515 [Planctomycetes bacterium]|nr:hypothetical protein [Planctomycetota bacterium]